MSTRYYIRLPDPATARGDDPDLAFRAHGAEAFAEELQDASTRGIGQRLEHGGHVCNLAKHRNTVKRCAVPHWPSATCGESERGMREWWTRPGSNR